MDQVNDLHLQFGAPVGLIAGVAILAAVGLLTAFLYRRRLHGLSAGRRRLIVGLRVAVVVLVCFLLLDPMLVGKRLDPGQNYLLMLFDDSRSMTVPDREGQGRGERLREAYRAVGESFEGVLRARYRLAMYRYGDRIERIDGLDELGFDQPASRHGDALRAALRDYQGANVAAVLLFSDGAEQPSRPLENLLAELPEETPVVTVGIGDRQAWRDLALTDLSYARGQGDQRPVSVKVAFRAEGLAGRDVVVDIMRGPTALASKSIAIESDDAQHQALLEFTPTFEGWVAYQARVRLAGDRRNQGGLAPDGDWVHQNNARAFLVDNRPSVFETLYFAGRPNWENKFIQRALRDDKEMALTSVLRISAAETKFVYRGKKSSLVNPLFEGFYQDEADQPRYDEAVFLRFGGDPASAGKGFPEKEEELFGYDLVALGDIEAGFFSQAQLQAVREFVRKRGGALLLLGGPHSFSEGGYEGTVLEGMMPVLLERGSRERSGRPPSHLTEGFQAQPTVEGELSGVWTLDPNPEQNRRLWENMPELAGLNLFPAVRPGAAVMARAESPNADIQDAPLFAVQRFGEGRAAVLATGATWQWHMSVESGDERHGRFWRRLLRSLAMQAPDPALWRDKRDVYLEDRPVPVELLVRDKMFERRAGLSLRTFVKAPDGEEMALPMDESLREVGVFAGRFRPERPGVHQLAMTAEDAEGKAVAVLDEAFLVEPDREEYRHARYDPDHLRGIAQRTGGRFFTLDELDQIPDRIPWARSNVAREIRIPFWSLPAFFFVIAALWLLEWTLRRKGGHA